MAEINNSIALQVQPNNGLDLGKTFMTLAQLQMAQAHANLYGLQAAQQQRQLAGYQVLQQTGNPLAALRAGLDPNIASTAQTMQANQRAYETNPNQIDPGKYGEAIGARAKAAELTSKIAGGVIASEGKNDEAWSNAIRMHVAAFPSGNPLGDQRLIAQGEAIKDPAMRVQIAKTYSAGGISPDVGNKPTTVELPSGAKGTTTPLGLLQGSAAPPAQGITNLTGPNSNVISMGTPVNAPVGAGQNPQYAQGLAALRAGQNVTGAAGAAAANGQLAPQVAQAGGPAPPLAQGPSLARQKETELEVARGDKTLGGIQAQATQYERDTKPYLMLARSILNDPKMYSGTLAERRLDFNKVRAIWGDNKAAMLQEGLKKVTATSVLGQINTQRDQLQEAGGTASRIFAQQVGLVEQAAPALSTTPAGNRFLVEVSMRMGELSSTVAQKARDYKLLHGHLDAGFDNEISDYMKKHPVFSEKELSHLELLGAPTSPHSDTQRMIAWGREMKLSPGEPIRTPSGKYVGLPSQ